MLAKNPVESDSSSFTQESDFNDTEEEIYELFEKAALSKEVRERLPQRMEKKDYRDLIIKQKHVRNQHVYE